MNKKCNNEETKATWKTKTNDFSESCLECTIEVGIKNGSVYCSVVSRLSETVCRNARAGYNVGALNISFRVETICSKISGEGM